MDLGGDTWDDYLATQAIMSDASSDRQAALEQPDKLCTLCLAAILYKNPSRNVYESLAPVVDSTALRVSALRECWPGAMSVQEVGREELAIPDYFAK